MTTLKIPSPSQWARCLLKDRENHLPGRAGVYAIFDQQGHLYYIGMAKNLTNRWSGASHHRYQQALDTIENPILAWQIVDGRSVRSVETALIRKYQPDWNNTPEYNPIRQAPPRQVHYPQPKPTIADLMADRLMGKFAMLLGVFVVLVVFSSIRNVFTYSSYEPVSETAPATTLIRTFPNSSAGTRILSDSTVEVLQCQSDDVEVIQTFKREGQVVRGNVRGWVRNRIDFKGKDVCGDY